MMTEKRRPTRPLYGSQSLKRADAAQDCIDQILRQRMNLADTGPENLVQVISANIPAEPFPGQAVAFPVEVLAANGIPQFAGAYSVVVRNGQRAPNAGQQ